MRWSLCLAVLLAGCYPKRVSYVKTKLPLVEARREVALEAARRGVVATQEAGLDRLSWGTWSVSFHEEPSGTTIRVRDDSPFAPAAEALGESYVLGVHDEMGAHRRYRTQALFSPGLHVAGGEASLRFDATGYLAYTVLDRGGRSKAPSPATLGRVTLLAGMSLLIPERVFFRLGAGFSLERWTFASRLEDDPFPVGPRRYAELDLALLVDPQGNDGVELGLTVGRSALGAISVRGGWILDEGPTAGVSLRPTMVGSGIVLGVTLLTALVIGIANGDVDLGGDGWVPPWLGDDG